MRNSLPRARRLLMAALVAIPALGCEDPTAVDRLGDFMILSPGDYFFAAMASYETSPTSADSILFQWSPASGAERYSIVFALAASADSAEAYLADLSAPTFSIAVDQPREIEVPWGGPPSPEDTVPAVHYRALEHAVPLSAVDDALGGHPQDVPLYFVWSIEAHRGSTTARSVEKHRMILTRRGGG